MVCSGNMLIRSRKFQGLARLKNSRQSLSDDWRWLIYFSNLGSVAAGMMAVCVFFILFSTKKNI